MTNVNAKTNWMTVFHNGQWAQGTWVPWEGMVGKAEDNGWQEIRYNTEMWWWAPPTLLMSSFLVSNTLMWIVTMFRYNRIVCYSICRIPSGQCLLLTLHLEAYTEDADSIKSLVLTSEQTGKVIHSHVFMVACIRLHISNRGLVI